MMRHKCSFLHHPQGKNKTALTVSLQPAVDSNNSISFQHFSWDSAQTLAQIVHWVDVALPWSVLHQYFVVTLTLIHPFVFLHIYTQSTCIQISVLQELQKRLFTLLLPPPNCQNFVWIFNKKELNRKGNPIPGKCATLSLIKPLLLARICETTNWLSFWDLALWFEWIHTHYFLNEKRNFFPKRLQQPDPYLFPCCKDIH